MVEGSLPSKGQPKQTKTKNKFNTECEGWRKQAELMFFGLLAHNCLEGLGWGSRERGGPLRMRQEMALSIFTWERFAKGEEGAQISRGLGGVAQSGGRTWWEGRYPVAMVGFLQLSLW